MVCVIINGQERTAPEGVTILRALNSLGIDVPSLCDDPRLKPIGACRLCLVQVAGMPNPVAACTTPLVSGMQILTHTPELERLRRTNLRLLALRYPRHAFENSPDNAFHHLLRTYHLENEIRGDSVPALIDPSHPSIWVDMSRCIYCYRCVRICEEVQGQFVWRIWNRGDRTSILPDSNTTLRESSCVSCGACVDTCPTGALEDQTVLKQGPATRWTNTICPYCGVGCEISAGVREGQIVSIKPAIDSPVNKGHLCVKGRYSFAFVRSPQRITDPMIRQRGDWIKVDWGQALEFIATELRRIIHQHGPESAGMLGSARATNEDNYLTQKFARVVLGTNNVDCCARVCHAPSAAALNRMLGAGAATNSFDDIEKARTILVCGANPTENHPVLGARIKQARLRGAHLIVIDPRKIELAHYADLHLQPRPGTNVPLFNAMACSIIEEYLQDSAAIGERVTGWDEFCQFIQAWTPDKAASICQIDPTLIRQAARLYATAKPSISFHGLGLTEHVQGTESAMCLINLALITGNFGKPGTGVNPLRGQNNVQGAAHMGCEPNHLTGYAPIAENRAAFEQIWNAPIPSAPGLNSMQMIDAALTGKLKALWIIGYDIAQTNPQRTTTINALNALELVIVQDLFLNPTASIGTVFLPAASAFEKDGTFMNAERRVQRVRKVVEPVGQSKPDWQILCEAARAMGRGESFNFHSPNEIWEEIRAVWKAGRGITYQRIESRGLQWPCPSEDHPGTDVLHETTFFFGQRATLERINFSATPETPTNQFPFLLVTGRTLYQFNNGTMTNHPPTSQLRPADFLDISPEDAEELKLHDGSKVRVESRYGKIALLVQINPALRRGHLFTTFHMAESSVNETTSQYRDSVVDTPEYKVTAVNLTRMETVPVQTSNEPC